MGERLDAESVREIMNRYFELARLAIERHHGTVEKYIGDAVMAAFGIPTAHEDDALRATRAAAEVRDALEQLNAELIERMGSGLRVRIGVNTGEVIASDPSAGQAFASGDAVNVAARLEQAAPPGEVLLGERTHALVRDAVTVEATEPLELKGKSEPVPAYRLVGLRSAERGIARRLHAPLVGREQELAELEAALDRATADDRAELVLVLGEAGLGKSRLAGAFLERARGAAAVLESRCPSYGEGALYPLRGALLRFARIDAGASRETAHRRLAELVGEGEELLLRVLAAFLGLTEHPADIRDAAWAIRRLCERLSAERPLVVMIDDVHWADPALLELASELSAGREHPLLVLALSRPDLIEDEDRAAVFGSAKTIRLTALRDQDQDQIARQVLGEDPPSALAERLRERAAGNPLFLEELLRSLTERGLLDQNGDGDGVAAGDLSELGIPDSVEALLTARVESLALLERATLEAAAVAEDSIWPGAVAALQPERTEAGVVAEIECLIERGFLVSVRSRLAGQRQLRFAHVLMREAAYSSITKRRRAALHGRMAEWLARPPTADLGFAATIGRHLEAAHRYRSELGDPPAELAELARRAAAQLARGGDDALEQEDDRQAAELLERAAVLATDAGERAKALTGLAEARYRLGEFEGVIESTAGSDRGRGRGRRRGFGVDLEDASRRCARTIHPGRSATAEARAAVAALAGTNHDAALTGAWSTLAHALTYEGKAGPALDASEHAVRAAQRTGRRRWEVLARESQLNTLLEGPAPVTLLAGVAEECLGPRPGLG